MFAESNVAHELTVQTGTPKAPTHFGTICFSGTNLVGGVDLGALSQQHFHHGVVTVCGGDVETRFPVQIGAVQQVRRPRQEQTDHGHVAAETCQVQRVVSL